MASLIELEACFLKRQGDGSSMTRGVTLAEADGILFLCPKCFEEAKKSNVNVHSIICWFVDKVPDGLSPGPGRWTPQGTCLEDLTFVPSPRFSHSVLLTSGCQWHGFVTNGHAD